MKEIQMRGRGRGNFAQVDDSDYEYLMQWEWYLNDRLNRRVAIRGLGFTPGHGEITREMGYEILLHAGLNMDGYEVQYQDGDGLNCRRSNLKRVEVGESERW